MGLPWLSLGPFLSPSEPFSLTTPPPTADVDECRRRPHPCPHGHCENSVGSYSCRCWAGYEAADRSGTGCQGEFHPRPHGAWAWVGFVSSRPIGQELILGVPPGCGSCCGCCQSGRLTCSRIALKEPGLVVFTVAVSPHRRGGVPILKTHPFALPAPMQMWTSVPEAPHPAPVGAATTPLGLIAALVPPATTVTLLAPSAEVMGHQVGGGNCLWGKSRRWEGKSSKSQKGKVGQYGAMQAPGGPKGGGRGDGRTDGHSLCWVFHCFRFPFPRMLFCANENEQIFDKNLNESPCGPDTQRITSTAQSLPGETVVGEKTTRGTAAPSCG